MRKADPFEMLGKLVACGKGNLPKTLAAAAAAALAGLAAGRASKKGGAS